MAASLLSSSSYAAAFSHSRRDVSSRSRLTSPVRTRKSLICRRTVPCKALEIDWTAPDTLIGLAGAVLGIGLGIGVPVFYISRDTKDKESLEYVRELNRKRFAETGEYMTKEEIAQIRQPRWTDNREFQDDD